MTQDKADRVAILGAGNIGTAIARGIAESGRYAPAQVMLTRRKLSLLDWARAAGFAVEGDNCAAVSRCRIVILAVEPQQLDELLEEIATSLQPAHHVVISVVSGVSVAQIAGKLGDEVDIVRAMPNTAIALRESMTCIASQSARPEAIALTCELFDALGKTLVIDEEQMTSATALGACGVAFFLRAIRAASQGGIEIGFHSHDALAIAAQTAKGAASLLLGGSHPEHEIDKVTTPRGCTIAGLNRMEHEGFSSAMIKGITTSAQKAAGLYPSD